MFNIVVDVVARHYLITVSYISPFLKGFYWEVQLMVTFFWSENRLLTSTQLQWIQWALYVLIGIFEGVVLNTNVKMLENILCQTCCILQYTNTRGGTGKIFLALNLIASEYIFLSCRRLDFSRLSVLIFSISPGCTARSANGHSSIFQ